MKHALEKFLNHLKATWQYSLDYWYLWTTSAKIMEQEADTQPNEFKVIT